MATFKSLTQAYNYNENINVSRNYNVFGRIITFMSGPDDDSIGGVWLMREYGIQPVQPLRYQSHIGASKRVKEADGTVIQVLPSSYRPENTLVGHLEFMLKHERISLELLSRLFARTGEVEIAEWVLREPTGRYSRRAGWLYEWLTGKQLNIPELPYAPYIDALDSNRYWVAPKPDNDPRWHVRNNMPGTSSFCPMVLLNDGLAAATEHTAFEKSISDLESEFGEDLIMRSAVWLTTKESRASFQIEGEHELKKAERFAVAMENRLGKMPDLFGNDLVLLQREILGERALHYGLRRSPIFVGETVRLQPFIHYIGPHYNDVPSMLDGLSKLRTRTVGSSSLIRAAVLSFAFVYIHPLADGNGRLSRFIINDVLRSDGIIKAPIVIPISATIAEHRADYDRVLETFSSPFRQRYMNDWKFGSDHTYDDGIVSNLEFDSYDDAIYCWKYLDLTDHCEYLAKTLTTTVSDEMHREASFLRKLRQARRALNDILEGGDNSFDRMIRSVVANKKVTGALAAEFPVLLESEMADKVVEVILQAMDDH